MTDKQNEQIGRIADNFVAKVREMAPDACVVMGVGVAQYARDVLSIPNVLLEMRGNVGGVAGMVGGIMAQFAVDLTDIPEDEREELIDIAAKVCLRLTSGSGRESLKTLCGTMLGAMEQE